MQKNRKIWFPLFAALVITLVFSTGILSDIDNAVSDALYQRPRATDGEVIVIAMDQRSLEALGPMPWPRSYMAQVIEMLNADAENAPAVIGLDVIYVGKSSDPEADARLVQAAAQGGNVVVAGAAQFGSQLVTDGDLFSMDTKAVLAFDAPFDALAAQCKIGHVNTMADADGFIRHALLSLETPEGEEVLSLARVVYEQYAAYHGLELSGLPATDRDGFFYLPFTTGPGGYDNGISFVDVLDGLLPPEVFAGKAVLIGPYAAGMQDAYRSSVDHAVSMYGVEFQANQIEAFRRGDYPREMAELWQLALLLLWCALLAWQCRDRDVVTGFLIWAVSSVLAVLLCLGAFSQGFVLHALWFPLASTVIFVGSVAENYARSSREKRRVINTFGRYVDPAILKELLVQGGAAEQLGGKVVDIAVLFVDIRGFTTMSEALEPSLVVEIINRYLTLTTRCIMRYQGTLDKFVGDCTMAFWNAPVAQEDAAYLACRAAMDMVTESKALKEELQRAYGRSVDFGVGVHVGPAVVGNIGAPQRMDFTAIGDTVNTAARLEANAPAGTILISKVVADALGSRAKTTSLGNTIKLKGKSDEFEILMLDSLSE